MPKVKIFKLITGEEIIAMYIKSKLFTVVIDTPVTIQSMGSLPEPKANLEQYTLYGSRTLELKRSSIVSIVEPIPEMRDFYTAVVDWINNVICREVASSLEAERKQMVEFVAASDVAEGESPKSSDEVFKTMSEETKAQIFTKVLESWDHTGEVPN